MKKYLAVFLFLVVLVKGGYCEQTLPADNNGNFILSVSNQSFDINPVDIKVYIDDKLAVDREFDVGQASMPQHNWQEFRFSLVTGTHTIRIISVKGEAELRKEFVTNGKLWAALSYWYYPVMRGGAGPTPKSFEFMTKEEPILFE